MKETFTKIPNISTGGKYQPKHGRCLLEYQIGCVIEVPVHNMYVLDNIYVNPP